MDKKLEKLKKLLSKLNVDEEKQNEIIAIITEEDEEVEESPIEEPAEEVKPDGDNEGKGDEEIPAEEVPAPEVPPEEPAAEEEVPPVPLPEGTEEVDPSQIGNEEPPAAPNTDEVPNPAPVDNTVELETKIAKQEELISALQKKIDSLSEALQNAGILKADATNQVGVDDNQTPANNPIDDPLGDVLAEINGRR